MEIPVKKLFFAFNSLTMQKNLFDGVRNIIFDLGGVLIDLDFTTPVREFEKLGGNSAGFDYRQAIRDPVFRAFETGGVTPHQFRQRIREILGNSHATDQQIDAAWCSMMDTIPPEKIALIKKLSTRYRLFLFSNTNTIHITYFLERFEKAYGYNLESLFEQSFYSHVIRERKPLPSSFEKVLNLAGIRKEETLFVDDFEENIKAAEEFGLKVIHYIPGTDLAHYFNGTR